jgi:urease accessory protein UreH
MWSAGSSASSCISRYVDVRAIQPFQPSINQSSNQSPNQTIINHSPDLPIIKPPDLQIRQDFRDPAAIGRHARLELAFETRRGRTVIAHAYAEPPFRVRAFDVDGAAYVIIVCSGPGVFGGDSLQQSIHVGPGARALLTSQAALQAHPGHGPPAVICHEYRVDRGGELHCHWDPLIPFAAASVSQRFCIDAAADSRLYWSDSLTAGRIVRGEAWQFAHLAHELRLRVGGNLTYLERFGLAPRERRPTLPWIAGGAVYFATTIVKHPDASSDAAGALHQQLQRPPATYAAVDTLEDGLIVARIASSKGAQFATARGSLRHAVIESVFRQTDLLARK